MAPSSKWREVIQKASLKNKSSQDGATKTAPAAVSKTTGPAAAKKKGKASKAVVISVQRPGVLPRNAKIVPDRTEDAAPTAADKKKKKIGNPAVGAPKAKGTSAPKATSPAAAARDPEAQARAEALSVRLKRALAGPVSPPLPPSARKAPAPRAQGPSLDHAPVETAVIAPLDEPAGLAPGPIVAALADIRGADQAAAVDETAETSASADKKAIRLAQIRALAARVDRSVSTALASRGPDALEAAERRADARVVAVDEEAPLPAAAEAAPAEISADVPERAELAWDPAAVTFAGDAHDDEGQTIDPPGERSLAADQLLIAPADDPLVIAEPPVAARSDADDDEAALPTSWSLVSRALSAHGGFSSTAEPPMSVAAIEPEALAAEPVPQDGVWSPPAAPAADLALDAAAEIGLPAAAGDPAPAAESSLAPAETAEAPASSADPGTSASPPLPEDGSAARPPLKGVSWLMSKLRRWTGIGS